MKKVSDLERKDKHQLQEQLEAAAESLGMGFYSVEGDNSGYGPNHSAIVGLCSNCAHYEYVENDVHQVVFAHCERFEKPLGKNKVKNCSSFVKRGQLSLNEMYAMAIVLDVPKPKIGF